MRQPWLPGNEGLQAADDFSPASDVRPARAVALALALALLLLAMGRSGQIVDVAFGLEPGALADALLAAAEAWHGTMTTLGLPEALASLHRALGLAG